MCKEHEHENLFSGLMLGGLIGVALGILFAPLAGDEARGKIKKKLEEFDFDDILNKFSDAFKAGKDEALKVAREEEE